MLLRFTVENHASFRARTELSFVATARKDEPSHTFPCKHAPHGVLPVVGLWGANAAGKSNLLHAYSVFVSHVENSFVKHKPDAHVPWFPFGGDRGRGAPPTTMSADITLRDGVRLHYGFRFRAEGYEAEWLYRYEGARRTVLFVRDHAGPEPWYFAGLKGQKQAIAEATRQNCLFLSAAAQFNHPELAPIWAAITGGCRFESPVELFGNPLFEPEAPLLAEANRPRLLQFLEAADTGIVDLEVVPVEPFSPSGPGGEALEKIYTPEFLDEVRRQAGEAPRRLVEVRFRHAGPDGASFLLKPEMESRGTQILLSRLADLTQVLRAGQVLVIDEIDTSLHPDLCALLVGLFTDPMTNPGGAQLFFTTHDRGLLERLRTDEVVLVDKGQDGGSVIAAASDYRGVRTRDNLRRAHEEGRLRGVPVLGPLGQIVSFELQRG